jgi:hypothetical protein
MAVRRFMEHWQQWIAALAVWVGNTGPGRCADAACFHFAFDGCRRTDLPIPQSLALVAQPFGFSNHGQSVAPLISVKLR